MPKNCLEWLGVISSLLTIISFGLYLAELFKRKSHDSYMLGFLHGIKSLIEPLSQHNSVAGSDIKPMLLQVNDALARLQPPQKKS